MLVASCAVSADLKPRGLFFATATCRNETKQITKNCVIYEYFFACLILKYCQIYISHYGTDEVSTLLEYYVVCIGKRVPIFPKKLVLRCRVVREERLLRRLKHNVSPKSMYRQPVPVHTASHTRTLECLCIIVNRICCYNEKLSLILNLWFADVYCSDTNARTIRDFTHRSVDVFKISRRMLVTCQSSGLLHLVGQSVCFGGACYLHRPGTKFVCRSDWENEMCRQYTKAAKSLASQS